MQPGGDSLSTSASEARHFPERPFLGPKTWKMLGDSVEGWGVGRGGFP